MPTDATVEVTTRSVWGAPGWMCGTLVVTVLTAEGPTEVHLLPWNRTRTVAIPSGGASLEILEHSGRSLIASRATTVAVHAGQHLHVQGRGAVWLPPTVTVR